MTALVCTLQMSKESGVTITVENADGGITQTVTMDGTTLKLEVAGGDDTSTYTQTADAIKIECKDFTVVAKNSITCTSQDGPTVHTAEQDTFTIAADAKDLKLSSGANIVEAATADLELSGANIKAAGDTAVKVEAPQISISGQKLTLDGSAQVAVSGAQVSVKADAQLSAESSAMATLGGTMTTIKGTLINAG